MKREEKICDALSNWKALGNYVVTNAEKQKQKMLLNALHCHHIAYRLIET